jgi:ABC-2 type transport system ATP-binding protein
VFISSHILGEIQQLADVVGIIASGSLVREGPMDQLLLGESVVRVRVGADEIEPATSVLTQLAPDGVTPAIGEDGWLSVRIEPDRAAEVNRALAAAGIFASGLETGSDLESLFLSLTGGPQEAGGEGTFFGLAGAAVRRVAPDAPASPGPTDWRGDGGKA